MEAWKQVRYLFISLSCSHAVLYNQYAALAAYNGDMKAVETVVSQKLELLNAKLDTVS